MRKSIKIAGGVVAGLFIIGLAAPKEDAKSEVSTHTVPTSVAVPVNNEPVAVKPVPTTTTTTAKAVSACDGAREAFLTGTPAEIESALRALIADRTANNIAREYAQYYLVRDKTNPDLREMDKSLIQTGCL